MARHSGTIIVAIVLALGLSGGALGAWWVTHARPQPGAFIDVLATPDGVVAVRGEHASHNAFLEVYDGARRRWHAMVPRYAGRPGKLAVAASARSVTIRIERAGHPRVFAFDTVSGAKLDSFDLVGDEPPDAASYTLPDVATAVGGGQSVELLTTPAGGAEAIGVALDERRLAWRLPLPWRPVDAWIEGGLLVVVDATGARFARRLSDGVEQPAPTTAPPGLGGLTFDAQRRELRAPGGATYAWPADALVPARHHVGGGVIWVVTPRAITALDVQTLRVAATIR